MSKESALFGTSEYIPVKVPSWLLTHIKHNEPSANIKSESFNIGSVTFMGGERDR